jgi:hypothetical protein
MKTLFENCDYEFVAPIECRQEIKIILNEYLLFYGELIYIPENEDGKCVFTVIAKSIGNTDKWFDDYENNNLNKTLDEYNNKLSERFFKVQKQLEGNDYCPHLIVLNSKNLPMTKEIIKGFEKQVNLLF